MLFGWKRIAFDTAVVKTLAVMTVGLQTLLVSFCTFRRRVAEMEEISRRHIRKMGVSIIAKKLLVVVQQWTVTDLTINNHQMSKQVTDKTHLCQYQLVSCNEWCFTMLDIWLKHAISLLKYQVKQNCAFGYLKQRIVQFTTGIPLKASS